MGEAAELSGGADGDAAAAPAGLSQRTPRPALLRGCEGGAGGPGLGGGRPRGDPRAHARAEKAACGGRVGPRPPLSQAATQTSGALRPRPTFDAGHGGDVAPGSRT